MAHQIGFKELFSNTFEKTTCNKLKPGSSKTGPRFYIIVLFPGRPEI